MELGIGCGELIPKWLVYGSHILPLKGVYPLVNVYIAMEAMAHRKFVGLPIDSMAIFQFANCKRSPGRVSEKSFAMGIFINHPNICSA